MGAYENSLNNTLQKHLFRKRVPNAWLQTPPVMVKMTWDLVYTICKYLFKRIALSPNNQRCIHLNSLTIICLADLRYKHDFRIQLSPARSEFTTAAVKMIAKKLLEDVSSLSYSHMCWGLNSHYFHKKGDGRQPNSRGLYTHNYKDSLLKEAYHNRFTAINESIIDSG